MKVFIKVAGRLQMLSVCVTFLVFSKHKHLKRKSVLPAICVLPFLLVRAS